MQYNQSDLEVRRAACLKWKDGFIAHSGAAYTEYLGAPVEGKLFERKKLSK